MNRITINGQAFEAPPGASIVVANGTVLIGGSPPASKLASVLFYENLLDDPDVRKRIKTVADCQELIDQMEDAIPHEDLPPCYDWLLLRRATLAETSQ